MELSPASDPDTNYHSRPSRRRSGRVTKRPEVLSPPSTASASKRKRANDVEEDVEAETDADAGSGTEVVSTEGEPDEEELKWRRKRGIKSNASTAKPAAKRAKTKGITSSLAIRPATSKPKSSKIQRQLPDAPVSDEGGLYAEVFTGDNNLDVVAEDWLKRFHAHESNAVMEIINLVLRASGCNLEVDVHDIEDPDNCTSRLTELQDAYHAQRVADYPLIAKNKSTATFKHSLTGFFNALVKSIAASGLLFDSQELMENIQVWVCAMSSAAHRPFRHTATLVSLAIMSALCQVARDLVENKAKTLRQVEGESKKGRVNKARVADLQSVADLSADRVVKLDDIITDWFDTVFVHRYRDVDPKIRVDCVTYLGEWIMTYPDHFFDAQHVRYLGWVLSDACAPTRLEVVKQMQKIYKDPNKILGLRQFTVRFRSRMVEAATRDAETSVRAAAIELVDILRDARLLEPSDIDAVGKLIFDAEPRIRKAVVGFFIASVEETFEGKLDDIGGLETVEEELPATLENDYDSLRLDWLRLKSLVELLHSFDAREETPQIYIDVRATLSASDPETRFTAATEAFIHKMPLCQDWELLLGYLLFDHSQSAVAADENNVVAQFKQACQLQPTEESILLDVLNVSIMAALAPPIVEKGKKSRKTKEQLQELRNDQEATAQHLSNLLPKLVKKFGAAPESASAVLRLVRILKLDVFRVVQYDAIAYSALLDDINRQFVGHEDRHVLAEAKTALLHAKYSDELGELADVKLHTLWTDTTRTLLALCKGEEMAVRGSLNANMFGLVSSTVLRLHNLASISDCTSYFETPQQLIVDKPRKKGSTSPPVAPMTHLMDILSRGHRGPWIEPDIDAVEDGLVVNAMKCLLFYFMWRTNNLRTAYSAAVGQATVTAVLESKEAFASALWAIITSRKGADSLRVAVAGGLLDLHTLFFSQVRRRVVEVPRLEELVTEMQPRMQADILKVFVMTERDFAKKSGKELEEDEELADLDHDDEPRSASPSVNGEDVPETKEALEERQVLAQQKHTDALVAEQQLCELTAKLVVAITAGVVDAIPNEFASDEAREKYEGPVRKRLVKNKARLGHNFKEVIASLDAGAVNKKKAKKGRPPAAKQEKATTKKGRIRKSQEVVDNESSQEDGSAVEEDHEEGVAAHGLTAE